MFNHYRRSPAFVVYVWVDVWDHIIHHRHCTVSTENLNFTVFRETKEI